MKAGVTISTDTLIICEGKVTEGRTTMEALLAALHHETSAYQHLRDLPMAHLHIEVWPMTDAPPRVPTDDGEGEA